MNVLIVVAVAAAVSVLVATERFIKLRRRARQRREMAYRLTAAAARAVAAERKQQAAVAASAELTSVIPAIGRPRPTFDGMVRQEHRPRPGRPHSTGPQRPGAAPGGRARARCGGPGSG